MNITEKILHLIFCKIPPERILSIIKKQLTNFAKTKPSFTYQNQEEIFLNFAETVLSERSEDEHKQLLLYAKTKINKLAERYHIARSFLLLLIDYAYEVLTLVDNEPRCKLEKVLNWRDTYLQLGQDTIICAYLAFHDLKVGNIRTDFTWPAVIRTNDETLQHLLEQGLSENHYHLNGSTQSFAVSWCRFMNNAIDIKEELDKFDRHLNARFARSPKDDISSIKDNVLLAAHIRTILFRAIHREDFGKINELPDDKNELPNDKNKLPSDENEFPNQCSKKDSASRKRVHKYIFRGENAFREEYIFGWSSQSHTKAAIDVLRYKYGFKTQLHGASFFCLDYALHKHLPQKVLNSPYRLLAGERYFLYTCSRACLNNDFSPTEKMLFYLYLLLKISFRGELIQVNKQIGFKNFANYQSRKDIAWVNTIYWWEAQRMALVAPAICNNLRSLEARIGPKKTVRENLNIIKNLDQVVLQETQEDTNPFTSLAERLASTAKSVSPNGLIKDRIILKNGYNDKQGVIDYRNFYVLHFPKRKDDEIEINLPLNLTCRHQKLRNKIKITAFALAEAFSRYPDLFKRVCGIDACSNELGCRPETFATEFRFLRNFNSSLFNNDSYLIENSNRTQLSLTYHAGEDFWDIADGLRAIDETESFFGIKRGDRIGHALALGVDPNTHYQRKQNESIINKQEYLDNLVWLLYRSQDFNVSLENSLLRSLQRTAEILLKEIYGDIINKRKWHVDLLDYYNSMKLRGDSPYLYKTGTFVKPKTTLLTYDSFCVNHLDAGLTNYRHDDLLAGLYFYYEYNPEVKRKGNETICIPIDSAYIHLITDMQIAMQFDLEKKGIIIECNPSSNVLIGTFGKYSKHPIFRFNDNGLGLTKYKNPQLHVCVNTDDLGVFDTSLEFEYALIYQALRSLQNDEKLPLFSAQEVKQYLQNLQNLSNLATFR